MTANRARVLICCTFLLAGFAFPSAAEDFTNAIHAFLQHRGEVEKTDGAIVVGILDEHGSSVIGCGKLDNGTDGEVNGDTVFSLYSSTCMFTALLTQDMVERGEMKLEDPAAKYLPDSVRMPTHNGKEITLRHLVTEYSGFPYLSETMDNVDFKRADSPFADYSAKDMFAFVSGYRLTCDPGSIHTHGSVDMGLLGQAMLWKTGTNYEELLVSRICGPLKMDSTRGTLTPEMKARFAFWHGNRLGCATPPEDMGLLMPLCGLSSTVNDLLKYESANLGFTQSALPALMEKVLPDYPSKLKLEREKGIVETAGGSPYVSSYTAFDKRRKRGVVVFCSSGNGLYRASTVGRYLLNSEWGSDRRPTTTHLEPRDFGLYVGQYQRSPTYALGLISIRQYFRNAPMANVYAPAGLGLALLVVLVWLTRNSRRRWISLGCLLTVGGILAALTPLVWSRIFCGRYQPRIGIRVDGGRFFVQATAINLSPVEDWVLAGPGTHPIHELLPPLPLELLPESGPRFFERLSGMPVIFMRDAQGKVTGLVVKDRGGDFPYEKISEQPPEFPQPLKRPAIVKLDTQLLDACVGRYEQAPGGAFPAGVKVMIWREGDQLFWRSTGRNAFKGTIEIYPESEAYFFNKLGGVVTFVRNGKGEVTALTFHDDNWPDIKAKKLESE